jgi:hypothetical protein
MARRVNKRGRWYETAGQTKILDTLPHCVLSLFSKMLTTPRPPAGRFALIIDGLCRVVAARERLPNSGSPFLANFGPRGWTRVAGPVIALIWSRLRRMAVRFTALAARLQAGTLRWPTRSVRRCERTPERNVREEPSQGNPQRPASPAPRPRLPNDFGWLVRLAPETACYRGQLQHFLSDPEVEELLAAAPQMARVVRPLCRMLGVEVPKSLARVPIRRPQSAGKLPPPQSSIGTPVERPSPATSAASPAPNQRPTPRRRARA